MADFNPSLNQYANMMMQLCWLYNELSGSVSYRFKVYRQQKMSTFYIKVFDLNRKNVVVWCYENARNIF